MIQGSIVALVTPMFEDGSIDWDSLDKFVEYQIDNGTNAIVAVGTTGESATLDPSEHCEVIGRIIKQTNKRVPIIAGTGANSTSEAIELTAEAKKLGADACLLVTPYYNKPTQEGLYLHHKAIAEAVEIDQILYNVPGRTAVDMLNETVLRIAELPNVVGIKDATGDIARGAELINALDGKISVYSGDDETAYKLILAGAQGNISVTANVAPRAMADLCATALQKDERAAAELNQQFMNLHGSMFVESNPIPVKYALYKMGLINSGIRLPLTMLDERYRSTVDNALKAQGLI